jgi:hypothetical protein
MDGSDNASDVTTAAPAAARIQECISFLLHPRSSAANNNE